MAQTTFLGTAICGKWINTVDFYFPTRCKNALAAGMCSLYYCSPDGRTILLTVLVKIPVLPAAVWCKNRPIGTEN